MYVDLDIYVKGSRAISRPLPSLPDDPLFKHGLWQKVVADFFDWNGNYWLLVSDYFSKYPFLLKGKLFLAVTVISLPEEEFLLEGTLAEVFTDNSPPFNSTEFSRLVSL